MKQLKTLNKTQILLLLLALVTILLIITVSRNNRENLMLKRDLGRTYQMAIMDAIYPVEGQLAYELDGNIELDVTAMAQYATGYRKNYTILKTYYPHWMMIPELREYTYQMIVKVEEAVDLLSRGSYEDIPEELKEEIIGMIHAGKNTFIELQLTLDAKEQSNNKIATDWYDSLNIPTEEVVRIIQEGLTLTPIEN